jgi:hypothetical protein
MSVCAFVGFSDAFWRGKESSFGCLWGEEKHRFRERKFSDIHTVIFFCLGACVRACVRAQNDLPDGELQCRSSCFAQ